MTDNARVEKRTDRAIPSAAAVSPSAIRSLILIVIN